MSDEDDMSYKQPPGSSNRLDKTGAWGNVAQCARALAREIDEFGVPQGGEWLDALDQAIRLAYRSSGWDVDDAPSPMATPDPSVPRLKPDKVTESFEAG